MHMRGPALKVRRLAQPCVRTSLDGSDFSSSQRSGRKTLPSPHTRFRVFEPIKAMTMVYCSVVSKENSSLRDITHVALSNMHFLLNSTVRMRNREFQRYDVIFQSLIRIEKVSHRFRSTANPLLTTRSGSLTANIRILVYEYVSRWITEAKNVVGAYDSLMTASKYGNAVMVAQSFSVGSPGNDKSSSRSLF